MPTFECHRLDAYKAAIEYVAVAHSLIRSFPPGHGSLADQCLRAATSVVLNIAEGAGEFRKPEKARFYRMARRSAMESAAVLDVFEAMGLARNTDLEEPGNSLIVSSPCLHR